MNLFKALDLPFLFRWCGWPCKKKKSTVAFSKGSVWSTFCTKEPAQFPWRQHYRWWFFLGTGTLGAGPCQPAWSHIGYLIKNLDEVRWDYWSIIQIHWGKASIHMEFPGSCTGGHGKEPATWWTVGWHRDVLIKCRLWSRESVRAPGCRAAFAQGRFTGCSWSTLAKQRTKREGRRGKWNRKKRVSYRKERVGFHMEPFIFTGGLLLTFKTHLFPSSDFPLIWRAISRWVIALGKMLNIVKK